MGRWRRDQTEPGSYFLVELSRLATFHGPGVLLNKLILRINFRQTASQTVLSVTRSLILLNFFMVQSNEALEGGRPGAKEADIYEHFDRHMSHGMYQMSIDPGEGWRSD